VGKALRIAFVGSRGIPVTYGGFESHIEEVSQRLINMGFQIYVTCESKRFREDTYNGIIRVHSPAIQGKTITVPTLNDFLAIFHLLIRYPDIDLIQCPPDVIPAVAILRLFGKKIVASTGGIEWKRPLIRRKYFSPGWKLVSTPGSWYLKFVEWLAVKLSHVVIADSQAIEDYLEKTYQAKNVVFISYGARELLNSNISPEKENEVLSRFGLSCGEYYLTVARIVAENNIDKEIIGFQKSRSGKKLAIVGNFNEKDGYMKHLLRVRNNDATTIFLDPIYDKETLGILRKDCFAYIHAYELGGTNPTLLEQMLFRKPILAYDVPFHREILQDGGIYFKNDDELAECIKKLEAGEFDVQKMGEWQSKRINEEYNWNNVAEKYATLFRQLLRS
jgi:glycosyltransferase involved in cell wall biosynthesis